MGTSRYRIGLATICLLVGCGSTGDLQPRPSRQPAENPTIGFGHYGAIKVGMTRDELLAATPVQLAQYGDNPMCAWLADSRYPVRAPYGELHVTLNDKGEVVGIDAPSLARTDQGVTVGSSRAQVITVYDDPADESTIEEGGLLLYGRTEGWLGFVLNSSGAVIKIRTGTKAYASGFSLCSSV